MVNVECEWELGEDEEILVALNGTRFMLYSPPSNFEKFLHGEVKDGSFFISRREAKKLAEDLLSAVKMAEELDEALRENK